MKGEVVESTKELSLRCCSSSWSMFLSSQKLSRIELSQSKEVGPGHTSMVER